ncbi:MAG: DedA family protein [Phycisphaerae bacterium]|nr:DedA family protein [Phycisphaerae bacterium]
MLDWAQQFIEHNAVWAYLIIVVWTFLEGETIVIICGMLAARQNGPHIVGVILSALAGSLAGDQTWFFVGRYKGKKFLGRRPWLQAKADKVHRLLEQWHTLLILGFRFLYGLRNLTPFVLGMGEVKTRRFVILNVIGATVWAVTFGLGGFVFGKAFETYLHEHYGKGLLGVCGLVFIIWMTRLLIRVRRARKGREALAAAGSASEPPIPPSEQGQ